MTTAAGVYPQTLALGDMNCDGVLDIEVAQSDQQRVAVLLENVPADLAGDGTTIHHQVQSALCAPLLATQGTMLGLIYLDNLGATHSFGEEDLEFLLTAFKSALVDARTW